MRVYVYVCVVCTCTSKFVCAFVCVRAVVVWPPVARVDAECEMRSV
jgi:hypothetical protein